MSVPCWERMSEPFGQFEPVLAEFMGDLAKLRRLVQNGTSIRLQDKDGKTLLHYAVLGGRGAIVRWLVTQKVPLDARDATGATALALARQSTSDADLSERRAVMAAPERDEGRELSYGNGELRYLLYFVGRKVSIRW